MDRIKSPIFAKYFIGEKLYRYDQRHSLQMRTGRLILDTMIGSVCSYSLANTNYNNTFGTILIDSKKPGIVDIVIRLRYGQQRDETIKHFYKTFTMRYKNNVVTNTFGYIISPRLYKQAILCGQKIFNQYKKDVKKTNL